MAYNKPHFTNLPTNKQNEIPAGWPTRKQKTSKQNNYINPSKAKTPWKENPPFILPPFGRNICFIFLFIFFSKHRFQKQMLHGSPGERLNVQLLFFFYGFETHGIHHHFRLNHHLGKICLNIFFSSTFSKSKSKDFCHGNFRVSHQFGRNMFHSLPWIDQTIWDHIPPFGIT